MGITGGITITIRIRIRIVTKVIRKKTTITIGTQLLTTLAIWVTLRIMTN
jgi:hypothetical protein